MAGLFGGIPKKKTLFGQIPMPPGYLGGIGDGAIERQQMEMGAQQPNMQAMTKKPSFLGEGGAGRAIAGSIGDFLLQYTGGQPIYAPAMQEQRQMQQRQQQMEQQRQASRSDWLWQQQWKKDNPDPKQPTEYERIVAASGLPPEKQIELLQQYAQNRANPVQGVPFTDEEGNSGLQFIRPNATNSATPGIQDGSTATNPKTGEKVVYRNGAWQPLGGGDSNVTSGF